MFNELKKNSNGMVVKLFLSIAQKDAAQSLRCHCIQLDVTSQACELMEVTQRMTNY